MKKLTMLLLVTAFAVNFAFSQNEEERIYEEEEEYGTYVSPPPTINLALLLGMQLSDATMSRMLNAYEMIDHPLNEIDQFELEYQILLIEREKVLLERNLLSPIDYLYQQQLQLYALLDSLIKSMNDTLMAIIRNLR